jgi:hypothetical protein
MVAISTSNKMNDADEIRKVLKLGKGKIKVSAKDVGNSRKMVWRGVGWSVGLVCRTNSRTEVLSDSSSMSFEAAMYLSCDMSVS